MTPGNDPLGKIVLLVDRDQKLGEMRARRLRLYGIIVHTASSIEEARVHFKMSRIERTSRIARASTCLEQSDAQEDVECGSRR